MSNIYVTYRNGALNKVFGFMKGGDMSSNVPIGRQIEEAIEKIPKRGGIQKEVWGWVRWVSDGKDDVYIVVLKGASND